LSTSALRIDRIRRTCLFLALSTLPVTAAAQTPLSIDSVNVFPQPVVQTASQAAPTQNFVIELTGKGFAGIADADLKSARIAVIPTTGVTPTPIPVLSRSLDNTTILAQFTAPANYALQGVTLSVGSNLVTASAGASACDFEHKVTLTPQIVPKSQAGNKYGNGVAKNFHAIQVSIVNECPMAIVVPLAGIRVAANSQGGTTNAKNEGSNEKPVVAKNQDADSKDACMEEGVLMPFSLDHVTSIFSADRKLTGRRAIYFNTVQALAAIGSAVQPFLARGFTQGVAILGGGFTTASKDVFVDMSAEQLQNLTSQSFGATEQVASHGSLQKFVFVRRSEKCKNSKIETELRRGEFFVSWELSPASAEAPTTQKATAAPAAK